MDLHNSRKLALARQELEPATCVLKFGSSVLEFDAAYRQAALEVYRHIRLGEKVVAVVSAVGGHTDDLLALGLRQGGTGASEELLARLARVGEIQSAALFGLTLNSMGVSCKVVDPHEIGLMAEGPPLDSDPVDVSPQCIRQHLSKVEVLVVPGFFAAHADHGVATLGRGGTDLSAVFIAAKLGADRVRLIKDVDGVYEQDPSENPRSKRFDQLSFDEAERASSGLIQAKAIHEAKADGLMIEVASLGADFSTEIGNLSARKGHRLSHRRLKVTLLGCGAVGGGVLKHLQERDDLFEVGPVLVRHPERHREEAAFVTDPEAALGFEPDIVIEAIGGNDLAVELMMTALSRGTHVISANKSALAAEWEKLGSSASSGRGMLYYSAAVGGGVPILETLARHHGEIVSVEGVMNGTCNYLLSRMGEDVGLEEALEEARNLGFAEADASSDLDGHDAAFKLRILARDAFGVSLNADEVSKDTLQEIKSDQVVGYIESGRRLKQIGRCFKLPSSKVQAEVRLEAVASDHPFFGVVNEQNCFLVGLASGEVVRLDGKGAGRWPTAAAVFSDVMDAQRHLQRSYGPLSDSQGEA